MIFFAQRMLKISPDARYADVMERALYNNVLGSMAQDGKHYFYVNPLEVWPRACSCNPDKDHVKSERQGWFGCACCPPNVARLLTSLNQYIYTIHGDTLYTNLYIGSELTTQLGGTEVAIQQKSTYPWKGTVSMKINPAAEAEFGIALRIPSWSEGMEIRVNGEALNTAENIEQGYLVIRRLWSAGDIIEVHDPMETHRIYAHPNLRADAQKVTIQRGPLVYCLESIDNGEPLSSISLKQDGEFTAAFDETLLGGAVVIEADGVRVDQESWSGGLYSREKASLQPVKVKAVPYYLWGNRGSGEMKVWIPEDRM